MLLVYQPSMLLIGNCLAEHNAVRSLLSADGAHWFVRALAIPLWVIFDAVPELKILTLNHRKIMDVL